MPKAPPALVTLAPESDSEARNVRNVERLEVWKFFSSCLKVRTPYFLQEFLSQQIIEHSSFYFVDPFEFALSKLNFKR